MIGANGLETIDLDELYIVFDLEFTVSPKKKRYQKADIVQIGAVKLRKTDAGPEMVDTFHTYVFPENGLTPNKETLDFLKIEAKDFSDPIRYPEMVEQLLAWIGECKYFLCTWGDDDRQKIVEHCKRYEVPLEWFKNFNDIQLAYTRLKSKDVLQRTGLAKALEASQMKFVGQQHNAMDDAFNTAKIFRTIFNQITMVEKDYEEPPLVASEVVYRTKDDAEDLSHQPLAKYAELLKKFIS